MFGNGCVVDDDDVKSQKNCSTPNPPLRRWSNPSFLAHDSLRQNDGLGRLGEEGMKGRGVGLVWR